MPKAKRKVGRPNPPVLDPVSVSAALVSTRGNLHAVADQFGVTRNAVQELIRRTPALQQVVADARAGMVDAVESRFYEDCLKNSPAYQTSRIFFLKTQGKDRGYVERQEIEQKGQTRLVIEEEEVTADGDTHPQDPTPPGADGVPPE